MAVLLLAAVTLVTLELVTMKMMPFDNKSEFQVKIDMPSMAVPLLYYVAKRHERT